MRDNLANLNDLVTIVYSGASRQSAINNWDIFKRFYDGPSKLRSTIEKIGAISAQCAEAVEKNCWTTALEASEREWKLRCQLWPKIETTVTTEIDRLARKNGAIFSRVCGAGGGGGSAHSPKLLITPGKRWA